MRRSDIHFWGLIILGCIFCQWTLAVAGKGGNTEFYLIYSGNTLGELKPCGCAREEDQGGIERRQAYLKNLRALGKEVVLIDTGDSFKEPTRQGQIKAKFLMKSMDRMLYDAVALGDKDLIYGGKFLTQFKFIPWVASNIKVEEAAGFPPYRLKKLSNGTQIAFFSLAEPELFYSGTHAGITITSPQETLQFLFNQIREFANPDLFILMTHMQRKKALQFLDSEDVDIIINGHINKETDIIDMNPVRRNGKIFVQASPRSQKMGELLVSVNTNGLKNFQHQMVRLDSKIPFDPEMEKLYADYNSIIEEIFLQTLATRKNKFKKQIYATGTSCKTCHEKAHEIWQESRHSQAYATLKRVNKAFDPECLTCHTLAFNEPGGFVSENNTPELANVQCEICHGPGLEHAKDPKQGWSPNAAQACKKCHVKNHSPRFNFAEYWQRIQH